MCVYFEGLGSRRRLVLWLWTEPWGMPPLKGRQGVVPAMVVLVSTFTVNCGEVCRCSTVAGLLVLSPTHGSLSSEQENETGSPE
jgi:hypothetical protein